MSVDRNEWIFGSGEHRLVIVVPVPARRSRNGNDKYPFRFEIGGDLLPERQQNVIDDYKTIVSVVGNSGDLRRMQPQIQSMENTAGQRDAEIRFDMRVVIPHQSGDAVAGL